MNYEGKSHIKSVGISPSTQFILSYLLVDTCAVEKNDAIVSIRRIKPRENNNNKRWIREQFDEIK